MTLLEFLSSFFKNLNTPKVEEKIMSTPPVTPTPNLPSNKKELWYPKAKKWTKDMPTRGKYRKIYPEGAVVHYTAGDWGTNAMDSGIKDGFVYMLIDEKGNVYQANPLDSWGDHAGDSSWTGLGTWVSKYLVGIEMSNGGILTTVKDKHQTWFKKEIPEDQVRVVKNKDNVKEGSYQKYTKEQEDSLVELLLWLKENNPEGFSFDLVLGHDEVAPKRKNDPGGALSCTMPEFREKLKKLYKDKF